MGAASLFWCEDSKNAGKAIKERTVLRQRPVIISAFFVHEAMPRYSLAAVFCVDPWFLGRHRN